MIDAVLSYHMNPQTCGVAKFNHALAKRLGVPCLQIEEWWKRPFNNVLISIKPSEMRTDYVCADPWLYDLLLHDRTPCTLRFGARRVWYADETGCPPTIDGNPRRGAYRVLAFGMAHKLSLPHFEALKQRLDIEHPDYTVELSTAVHEGNPWDVALTDSVNAMRTIFGDKLRVLGYLGDDALAKELQDCDAVACYYQPALRANNTTAWAALEAGKTLYTNTDEYSPPLDASAHSWEKLLEILRA